MRHAIAFLFFTMTMLTWSQSRSFKVQGILTTEDTNTPLESATVYLEHPKDSTLVTYTITDKNGNFLLEGDTGDKKLNLYISYVGYQTYYKPLIVDAEAINLNTITMRTDTNALEEVLITSRAPVTIKKDTLEFNVSSFKTKKDANVEDLLKELPGVEVDDEGNIKVNGRTVNKILVNGKSFFGDDPTIATRNLNKDMIDKIQVSDTKSDAEAFAGEAGDGENKTVNLVVKEDRNKGVFGRLAAGGGTDKRYEYAGMFNRFNNDQRISILAGGNNINSPGFSFGEIRKMFGLGNIRINFNGNGSFSIGSRAFGVGEGITTSRSLGGNYADTWGKNIDVTTNYFNSKSASENKTQTQRENILPNQRYFENSVSNSLANSDNHTANMLLKIEADSTLLISIEPGFTYSKVDSNYNNTEQTFNESMQLTNASTRQSITSNEVKDFNNDLNVTKRFGYKGAFLKLNLNNYFQNRVSEDLLETTLNTYGNTPEEIIRNQLQEGDQNITRFSTNLTYRLPLKENLLSLDFKYQYRNEVTKNILSSYDFNENNQQYNTNINEALSTHYKYNNLANIPGLRLEYNKEQLRAWVDVKYIYRTLKNTDILRPTFNLQRRFETPEFSTGFTYKFNAQKRLSLDYRFDNNAPGISQLQAFKDVTNPSNTIVGNPYLKPDNTHVFSFDYSAYNTQKKQNLYLYLYAYIFNDQITPKQTVKEDLTRETTYVNVDGGYRLYSNISYNRTIKKDSVRSVDLLAGIIPNINRNIRFNGDIQYASVVHTLTPYLGFRCVWNDILELRPQYNISFTRNTYNLDNFNDQDFLYHAVNLNSTIHLTKNLEWQNDMRYFYNPNIAQGFDKSSWFWNATLAYSFMKDKASLTLKAFDLLNQNTNARRTATDNYIQDSQNTVLKRYFMLTFSWKFNTLGAKGETDSGVRSYRLVY